MATGGTSLPLVLPPTLEGVTRIHLSARGSQVRAHARVRLMRFDTVVTLHAASAYASTAQGALELLGEYVTDLRRQTLDGTHTPH